MRKIVLLPVLLLAACSALPAPDAALRESLRNPLFRENYYSDLTDHFVNLQIHNDPVTQSGSTKALINHAREEALAAAQEASKVVSSGIFDHFNPVKEDTVGSALLVEDGFYIGTDFSTIPGLDLHVFLTTVVDPREGTFPDATALDLGSLKSPYGAQSYALPEGKEFGRNMTVVLYDLALKRIHGFAQLRP